MVEAEKLEQTDMKTEPILKFSYPGCGFWWCFYKMYIILTSGDKLVVFVATSSHLLIE